MPYTKTPIQATEQNKTVSLLYAWDNRGDANANTQDTLFKNVIMEPVGSNYFQAMKRDGIETLPLSPAINAPIIGMYYWANNLGANGPVFVFVTLDGNLGNSISVVVYNAYNFTQVTGGGNIATTTSDPNTQVGFQEFLYQSGAIDLCICTTGGTYKITQTTYTLSAALTGAPSGPDLVYFDGYLCATDGKNLVNSALNDPTSWPAGNFLAVDSYPDPVLKVARVGAYVVCLGSESVQYFYDAAGAVGTPFGAVVGATKHIGYIGGWASTGDEAYFIGRTGNSPPALYHMTGLKVEQMPSNPFTRMWIGENINQNATAGGATLAPNGSIIQVNGHDCYYVRTGPPVSSNKVPYPASGGASYLYDIDSSQWVKIGYQLTESLLIKQATQAVSTGSVNVSTAPTLTYFISQTNGTLKRFNSAIYQDDGVSFEAKFRTQPNTFGSRRVKFGSRLMLDADQTSTTSPCFISWTDDDYKTVSTPRSVDLQFAYQQLWSLGYFRARAFIISYTDNFPMRWKTIELDYDQGQE